VPSRNKQVREQQAAYRRGDRQSRSPTSKGRSPVNKGRSATSETVQGDLWG
jgi:hypothetical protein